jgi:hypothetical protein
MVSFYSWVDLFFFLILHYCLLPAVKPACGFTPLDELGRGFDPNVFGRCDLAAFWPPYLKYLFVCLFMLLMLLFLLLLGEFSRRLCSATALLFVLLLLSY